MCTATRSRLDEQVKRSVLIALYDIFIQKRPILYRHGHVNTKVGLRRKQAVLRCGINVNSIYMWVHRTSNSAMGAVEEEEKDWLEALEVLIKGEFEE